MSPRYHLSPWYIITVSSKGPSASVWLQIDGDGDDGFRIEDIRSRWEQLSSIQSRAGLRGTENKSRLTVTTFDMWKQFCSVLGEHAKTTNMMKHVAVVVQGASQNLWLELFHRLPSQLTGLKMYIFDHEVAPILLHRILAFFPNLEELIISFCVSKSDEIPTEARNNLANSIASLPSLKQIQLYFGLSQAHRSDWGTVVQAVRSKPILETVIFNDSGKATSPEDREAMQFGPRLHKARRGHDVRDPPKTLSEFVEAITAVRDRVDCLDYFFSQVDPNLYAPVAIANLS